MQYSQIDTEDDFQYRKMLDNCAPSERSRFISYRGHSVKITMMTPYDSMDDVEYIARMNGVSATAFSVRNAVKLLLN